MRFSIRGLFGVVTAVAAGTWCVAHPIASVCIACVVLLVFLESRSHRYAPSDRMDGYLH